MSAVARLSDPTVRRSIEDEIERLISLLDLVEPDPDLEPWLAGGIEVAGTDDREGDTSDDEWSLGWTTSGALGLGEDVELDTCDSEYSSGWPESCSQGRDAWERGGYRYIPGVDSES